MLSSENFLLGVLNSTRKCITLFTEEHIMRSSKAKMFSRPYFLFLQVCSQCVVGFLQHTTGIIVRYIIPIFRKCNITPHPTRSNFKKPLSFELRGFECEYYTYCSLSLNHSNPSWVAFIFGGV